MPPVIIFGMSFAVINYDVKMCLIKAATFRISETEKMNERLCTREMFGLRRSKKGAYRGKIQKKNFIGGGWFESGF